MKRKATMTLAEIDAKVAHALEVIGWLEDEIQAMRSRELAQANSPKLTLVEAMKKARASITRANIVATTVGSGMATEGGFDDAWALGLVLLLEDLGAIKVAK